MCCKYVGACVLCMCRCLGVCMCGCVGVWVFLVK